MEQTADSLVFGAETEAEYQRIRQRYPDAGAALLPVLLLAQREWGWCSPAAISHVAGLLDIPPARAAGVASFYPLLRTDKPAGSCLLRVCDGLSCRLMGAQAVLDQIRETLGIEHGETADDGRFTLERVPCLASCSTAPVMLVDDQLNESLSCQRLAQLLERIEE